MTWERAQPPMTAQGKQLLGARRAGHQDTLEAAYDGRIDRTAGA
jgi:hypothetical protein